MLRPQKTETNGQWMEWKRNSDNCKSDIFLFYKKISAECKGL